MALETPARNVILPVGLDGRYRVSSGTGLVDVPVACKGAWIDPDSDTPTFLLSFIQLGDPVHLEARFRFEGTRLSISLQRRGFEPQPTTLAGTADET